MPKPPAPPLARTSAAFSAVANPRPGASLVAIILALLLRLLACLDAAGLLPEDDEEYEDEHEFDAYALCGANPYALYPRPVGSAPHAIYVEAGLIADWILAGVRNRGMHPRAIKSPQTRHSIPVRAPPAARIQPGNPHPRQNTPQPEGADPRL